jgi:HEPN domain-containing protein
LSGIVVEKLKYRAMLFLKEAKTVDDSDLAIFFAEQAMQLYIKAVHYELFGDIIRGHRLRELLSILIRELRRHGFSNIADKLVEFVNNYRRIFILAEEAYTTSRYGEISYSFDEARDVIDVATKLIGILEEVVKNVKLG